MLKPGLAKAVMCGTFAMNQAAESFMDAP